MPRRRQHGGAWKHAEKGKGNCKSNKKKTNNAKYADGKNKRPANHCMVAGPWQRTARADKAQRHGPTLQRKTAATPLRGCGGLYVRLGGLPCLRVCAYSALAASSLAGAASACAGSAAAVSAASPAAVASAASVAGASALEERRERRVAFFLEPVLAMFSSKSTSSMKHISAPSPLRNPSRQSGQTDS